MQGGPWVCGGWRSALRCIFPFVVQVFASFADQRSRMFRRDVGTLYFAVGGRSLCLVLGGLVFPVCSFGLRACLSGACARVVFSLVCAWGCFSWCAVRVSAVFFSLNCDRCGSSVLWQEGQQHSLWRCVCTEVRRVFLDLLGTRSWP